MKAIIVPTSLSESLSVIDLGDRELDSFYKHIGCDCIDYVAIYADDKVSIDVIVDDEGLLNGSPINEYWKRACENGQANYPLAGRTVITMTDRVSGDTCDLDIPLITHVLYTLYAFDLKDLLCLVK